MRGSLGNAPAGPSAFTTIMIPKHRHANPEAV
jgi:hypothetical protein